LLLDILDVLAFVAVDGQGTVVDSFIGQPALQVFGFFLDQLLLAVFPHQETSEVGANLTVEIASANFVRFFLLGWLDWWLDGGGWLVRWLLG